MSNTQIQMQPVHMSAEDFKMALPKQMHGRVTPDVMDMINDALQDEFSRDQFMENFISYTSVLSEGRYKITDYVSAVKYVSHKVMGCNNQEAYAKTFPQRWTSFFQKGLSNKEMSAYVAMYNKSKLVSQVYAQSLIPTHILNAHVFQEAINTQREIMTDTTAHQRDRTAAANSLLTHLKAPETKQVELNIGVKESGELADLRATMAQFAKLQQEKIIEGEVTPRDIAHQQICATVKDEIEDVE